MVIKFKEFIKNIGYGCLIEASKIFKISYIIGSKFAFFSLSQIGLGVVGLFGDKKNVNLIFIIRTLCILAMGSLPIGISALFYHVPTYYGAIYSTLESKFLRLAIPLTCIALFISHPVGNQAFLYSFYWFIPAGIALIPKKSVFLEALANTFITHAFGSIIWLYTRSIDANTWNLLIGKVWAERLLIAVSMTALYYILIYTKEQLKNWGMPHNNWKQKYGTTFSCYNGR